MVAVYEWSEIIERIRHEQRGRSRLKVVVYPCSPLQVLDVSAAGTAHTAVGYRATR
jgi:hypothetical protein